MKSYVQVRIFYNFVDKKKRKVIANTLENVYVRKCSRPRGIDVKNY